MTWAKHEDRSVSDRETDLQLVWIPRGRETYYYEIRKISSGDLVFPLEFRAGKAKFIPEYMNSDHPDHEYVTDFFVVDRGFSPWAIDVMKNAIYADTNSVKGFAFVKDGKWVKSLVKIIFTDRIEGL